jgi:predicted extracellular nuclease
MPVPVVIDMPPPDGNWEPYEGMLVSIPAPLTIDGTYNFERYGEMIVSFDGRLFTPTEVADPGPAAEAVERENDVRRFVLDDGNIHALSGSPVYLPSGVDASRPLRTGSLIRGVMGIVDQRRSAYRLQVFTSIGGSVEQAPRPQPPSVAGDVRVASFNVLNLFNGDGRGGGFPTGRGADTADAYLNQRRKLVGAVQMLAPDVAALMEIENDGYGPASALARFVEAINTAGPVSDYRFVDAGSGPGTDAIRVALIYRASRVQPVGDVAVLEGGPFASHSRVPLARAFRFQHNPPFVVVANHFKSKGCGRDENAATGLDADQGDGQSCWNATRVESARRLTAWLDGDPTGTDTELVLLTGDFNAYRHEDPIRTILTAGYQDVFDIAGAEHPYSYVYDGMAGRLDHALVSDAMADRVAGAAEWHINSDEMSRFDYRNPDSTGPFRASDHDPLIVGLSFPH